MDTCLDSYEDDCEGPVEFHWNGDPGFKSWPRCVKHQALRVERRENSMEKYANCSTAPEWFDPSYAGESWDED